MALTLVATACGGGADSPNEPDLSAASQLIDLDGVDDLRSRFGAGDGDPRLLLLLSPT